MSRLPCPEPVTRGPERRSRLDELERPHDPPPVVRVNGLGRGRIAAREQRVCPLAPSRSYSSLVALAGAAGRRGRKLELRQRRAKIEPGSAGHDRHPAGGEDLVDRGVRERCVLPDRGSCVSGQMPTRRVGRAGWFVRIGSPS